MAGETKITCICPTDPPSLCPGNVCTGPKCGGVGLWHCNEEYCCACSSES